MKIKMEELEGWQVLALFNTVASRYTVDPHLVTSEWNNQSMAMAFFSVLSMKFMEPTMILYFEGGISNMKADPYQYDRMLPDEQHLGWLCTKFDMSWSDLCFDSSEAHGRKVPGISDPAAVLYSMMGCMSNGDYRSVIKKMFELLQRVGPPTRPEYLEDRKQRDLVSRFDP